MTFSSEEEGTTGEVSLEDVPAWDPFGFSQDEIEMLKADRDDLEEQDQRDELEPHQTGYDNREGLVARIKNARGTSIDLSGIYLTTISPEACMALRPFSAVDLSGNALTSLPDEFRSLKRLRELSLSDNSFAEVPEVLTALHLTSFNISDNPIEENLHVVFSLSHLTSLTMASCLLSTFDPPRDALPQLSSLDLSYNRISDFRPTSGDLTHLRQLVLRSNPISDTALQYVSEINGLTFLDIADIGLTTLPPSFAQLDKLQILIIHDNILAELPAVIGSMTCLREIHASENLISSIDENIRLLKNLTYLDLSHNSLTRLPRELAALNHNISLELDENELEDPLPALASRGTRSLFRYLRSLDYSTPQYECKVLLVGEGNVGKSSLVAALRGEPFVEKRSTTHGIELGQIVLSEHDSPDIRLNTWDFGGQEVYRITHQFFLSPRALYLLVWNPREGQEQNDVEDWCRRIKLRVGDGARVIIVATHADTRRPELDWDLLKTRYGDMLVGHSSIDSCSGTGLDSLKELMRSTALKLPQMGELLSDRWTRVREQVLGVPYPKMDFAEYLEVCLGHGLDEGDGLTLLTLLHDLGHVIHFKEDDGLRNIIVLNPEWLTKAIGYVLEDRQTAENGGVLEHAGLQDIWGGRPGELEAGYSLDLHPYFLRLMEKFDITYRLPESNQSLVAQMVPFTRPKPILWSGLQDLRLRELRCHCRMAEEATGIIAWLTVRNHRYSIGKHWRRGVSLVHDRYRSQAVFELAPSRRDLYLTVLGPSPEYFFHALRDGLEDLIEQRWPGLAYKIEVPCGEMKESRPCRGYFSHEVLITLKERGEKRVLCQECVNWRDVGQLLTGFEANDGSSVEQQLFVLQRLQERTAKSVEAIHAQGAQAANTMRVILRMMSHEASDTPRLFTIVPVERNAVMKALSTKEQYILTLWCEETGHEHPIWDSAYTFKPTKAWVTTVAPYFKMVVKVLQAVVPIASSVVAVAADGAPDKMLKSELDLASKLAEKTQVPTVEALPSSADYLSQGVTEAEGAGLRAFRLLLLKLDSSHRFGGMRPVTTSAGDRIWVCERHYDTYDPGLPRLQYVREAGIAVE